jgi:hypothetical protein
MSETVVQKTILLELMDAVNSETQFPPKSTGENEQQFLTRLLEAISKLSDVGWAKIPPPAQTWYNEAASAQNSGKQIPAVPGYQQEFNEMPESQTQETTAATPEATTNGGKAGAKRGVMQRVREIAVVDPKQTHEEIIEKLKAEGWTNPSVETVWICLMEVRNVFKAVESAGYRIIQAQ